MAGQQRRSVPPVPRSAIGTDRAPFDQAVKENLDVLLGRIGDRIEPLHADATLYEVVAKLNELILRLR